MLPSWLDVENQQILALLTIFGAIVGGFFVVLSIKNAAARAIMAIFLVFLGIGAFVYRQHLADCRPTCSCRVGEIVVPDPGCPDLG